MADETGNIIRVTKENMKPAARTLAHAFHEYPVTVFFMPDAAERERKQPTVFRYVLQTSIENGEVWATSFKMEGVAVWILADKRKPGRKPGFSIGRWWSTAFVKKDIKQRQQAFFKYSHDIRGRLMPDCYWYLQILGVEPALQGKGFSRRLLEPMLARADREGLPCFLETQLEKNVPLYQHFGFKVVEEGLIPGSNVYSWAMVREGAKR